MGGEMTERSSTPEHSAQFYAHTLDGQPKENWEPLFTADCPALRGEECPKCEALDPRHGHLNKVAWWTAKFAAEMFPPGADREAAHAWGYLAGLWHDLGKFAAEWQAYLVSKADIHRAETAQRVDHATAGAQHAVGSGDIVGHLLAFAIAGHHSGLLDAVSPDACLQKRLEKEVADFSRAPEAVIGRSLPKLPPGLATRIRNPAVPALFTRLLFSALVDADFLATEAFMAPDRAQLRPTNQAGLLAEMQNLLERHVATFPFPRNAVERARSEVRDHCRNTAERDPGIFSLTVPTGGGKTLSSLAFALSHATRHDQRRIIYVIPFTSIIEQNAAVFEDVFRPLLKTEGDPVVLQHHSNLSPENETERTRLAAENWDAPLVVTTAVQFYESIHAARTSGCRKLHNFANSVVILDEAQCLPVEFLRPCLDALRELTAHYRTSVVLCTATQPAIHRREAFPIGLEGVREIIPDPSRLYKALRRVSVVDRGALDDGPLAQEISSLDQVLAIVNTRGHAQALFRLLPENPGNFHLSALMCPAHREQTLRTVRERLDAGKQVRLISTQLVEAGVDIDFPRAYRALAGIDSIAQAAGRCNRNGRLPSAQLHVFRSEHQRSETFFRETAQIAQQVFALHEDALGLAAVGHFFELYYEQHNPPVGSRWDTKQICDDYRLNQDRKLPFLFQYRTVAEKFRLIENEQVPVLIPFDEKAKALLAELSNEQIPLHRRLLRGLQRYTVQIYCPEFLRNRAQFESVRDDQFHILICPEIHYSPHFGLTLGSDPEKPLIC